MFLEVTKSLLALNVGLTSRTQLRDASLATVCGTSSQEGLGKREQRVEHSGMLREGLAPCCGLEQLGMEGGGWVLATAGEQSGAR